MFVRSVLIDLADPEVLKPESTSWERSLRAKPRKRPLLAFREGYAISFTLWWRTRLNTDFKEPLILLLRFIYCSLKISIWHRMSFFSLILSLSILWSVCYEVDELSVKISWEFELSVVWAFELFWAVGWSVGEVLWLPFEGVRVQAIRW